MKYIDQELKVIRGRKNYGSTVLNEFDESKIKRAADGKFGTKGGSKDSKKDSKKSKVKIELEYKEPKKIKTSKEAKAMYKKEADKKFDAFEKFMGERKKWAEKTGRSDAFYEEKPTQYLKLKETLDYHAERADALWDRSKDLEKKGK